MVPTVPFMIFCFPFLIKVGHLFSISPCPSCFGSIIPFQRWSLYLIIYLWFVCWNHWISQLYWEVEIVFLNPAIALTVKAISWVCNKAVSMLKGPEHRSVELMSKNSPTGVDSSLFSVNPRQSIIGPQKTLFSFFFILFLFFSHRVLLEYEV